MIHSPVATSDGAMEFWFALFAEVLVRKIGFVDQAHAATVLPHRALVALDEEVAEVVAEGFEDCRWSV